MNVDASNVCVSNIKEQKFVYCIILVTDAAALRLLYVYIHAFIIKYALE